MATEAETLNALLKLPPAELQKLGLTGKDVADLRSCQIEHKPAPARLHHIIHHYHSHPVQQTPIPAAAAPIPQQPIIPPTSKGEPMQQPEQTYTPPAPPVYVVPKPVLPPAAKQEVCKDEAHGHLFTPGYDKVCLSVNIQRHGTTAAFVARNPNAPASESISYDADGNMVVNMAAVSLDGRIIKSDNPEVGTHQVALQGDAGVTIGANAVHAVVSSVAEYKVSVAEGKEANADQTYSNAALAGKLQPISTNTITLDNSSTNTASAAKGAGAAAGTGATGGTVVKGDQIIGTKCVASTTGVGGAGNNSGAGTAVACAAPGSTVGTGYSQTLGGTGAQVGSKTIDSNNDQSIGKTTLGDNATQITAPVTLGGQASLATGNAASKAGDVTTATGDGASAAAANAASHGNSQHDLGNGNCTNYGHDDGHDTQGGAASTTVAPCVSPTISGPGAANTIVFGPHGAMKMPNVTGVNMQLALAHTEVPSVPQHVQAAMNYNFG